jgi:sugar phosphate permease
MTSKFSEILLPSIVCIIVYLIINKLFPEKVESLGKDPIEALRGGVQDFKRNFKNKFKESKEKFYHFYLIF